VSKPIVPQMPFVWPEPRVSSGVGIYETALPFELAARAALSVFGVVSAIDSRAVNWMEGYLADSTVSKLRLVISIHPTCRTSEADLHDLLRLVERHGDRAAFKVFPEASLFDRSSILLCLCGADGDSAVSVGPTENMGFAPASPSQANLAMVVTAATFEACRKWFDYLWGIAGHCARTLRRRCRTWCCQKATLRPPACGKTIGDVASSTNRPLSHQCGQWSIQSLARSYL